MTRRTPLAEFLPYQLSITSNAVSGRIALEYRQRFGLSVPEWRVMAILGDSGPLTQRDLTRLTLMDKVAVNRACKVLEERDLASRQPNAQDGRSHLLELTAKGREKYNRETGSKLKAPQPQGGSRRDSFCARMEPVAEKSEKGSRSRASMQRWNCPGW